MKSDRMRREVSKGSLMTDKLGGSDEAGNPGSILDTFAKTIQLKHVAGSNPALNLRTQFKTAMLKND